MRRCAIQIIVLLLIAVIVVWLLRILVKEGGARRRKESLPGRTAPAIEGAPGRPCPLCNTPLERGQRVHSVTYPGKTDKIVEIYGCPNCRPKAGSAKADRVCPVCKQTLGEKDYVVGRMFERANQKKHLHVLGCTRCRKGA